MATILSLVAAPFAQLLVVLYPPVIAFWFIIHSQIEFWRKRGTRAYSIACLVWPLMGIPVVLFRERIFSRFFQPNGLLVVVGLVSALLAVRLGLLAAREIPLRTLVGLPELEPQKNVQPLLRRGIYSKLRHPVYVTHWLILLSAAALSGYAANWVLVGVDSALLPLMVQAEEVELRRRYGASFESYMRDVPRFLPRWP